MNIPIPVIGKEIRELPVPGIALARLSVNVAANFLELGLAFELPAKVLIEISEALLRPAEKAGLVFCNAEIHKKRRLTVGEIYDILGKINLITTARSFIEDATGKT